MISWGSVGNNWSMISWGSVGNNWSSISWSSLVSWSWSLWVGSGSLIGDISNISIITIGSVGHSLDSAIRKSNSVGSLNIAGSIRCLLSIEGSLGVVISNSVGVGVGGDLIGISLSLVSWGWGMIGWSGNNWGMIGGSSVGNNWGGMNSMSHNWGSMDSMSNWGMDTVG